MKLAIVFCAVLGLSLAAPQAQSQARDLAQDFEDILALIPLAEWRVIAQRYLKDDEEFRSVVQYLQGPEWAALVSAVKNHPTWIEFKVFLEEAGIDIEAIIKFIHDLIAGAETFSPLAPAPRGIREFIDECKALLDTEALLAVINDKLTNSPDFIELYEKLSSDKSKALVEEVRAMPEVQRVAARLTEMGIDVQSVIDWIYVFLGWA